MKKRAMRLFIIFTLFFTLTILSIEFISAASCDVRLRTNCQTDPWDNIVMGISASTNAHGELPPGTYPNVLCCDFSKNSACTGTNEILGLSTSTNAHAESPYGSYNNPICYGNLECDDVCDTTFTMPVLSLSAPTNAHIANATGTGSYSTKICCKPPSQFISPNCDLTSASWEFPKAMEGSQVDMILQGTNCAGAAIEFNIYEDEAITDTLITTTPINGNYDRVTWIAQWMDDGVLQGDPEYYFTAKAIVSGDTFSSLDSTTGNKILTVTKQDPDYCASITLCSDYTTNYQESPQIECESDSLFSLCNVAQRNENCVQGATCSCVWDSGECKFASTLSPAPVTCENGYTLCNTEPLLETGLDYCYPGSECPTDETPLSDGDSVCDVGEGCSSVDCKNGDTDSCVQGATCLSGECNIAGQTPVEITGCGHGYTLCNTQPLLETGMNYCYPGDTCPDDETPLSDGDGICEAGEGCSSSDCIPGGDPVLHKDTCLLDAYCKLGSCFSPTYAVGTCIYTESTDDDCSDGYLSYSWTATWEGTGTKPENCLDGNRVVPCPAQAQLVFFGVYQFIISFAIIIMIYLFFILKKKKKK